MSTGLDPETEEAIEARAWAAGIRRQRLASAPRRLRFREERRDRHSKRVRDALDDGQRRIANAALQ